MNRVPFQHLPIQAYHGAILYRHKKTDQIINILGLIVHPRNVYTARECDNLSYIRIAYRQ